MIETAENYDVTQYDRPSLTVDIVLFTLREKRLQVLLIQRKVWPFAGQWAIPGGFVRPDESLDAAAHRELLEETGVADLFLEQLHTFGEPGRDPRTRVVTVAYTALISSDQIRLKADTDASDAQWFPIDALPQKPLAFDHNQILDHALRALRERLETGSVAQGLLAKRFTLTQLQGVYEVLLGHAVDKRNFRKWVLSRNLVTATDAEARGAHRPAVLYEFAPASEGMRFPELRSLQAK